MVRNGESSGEHEISVFDPNMRESSESSEIELEDLKESMGYLLFFHENYFKQMQVLSNIEKDILLSEEWKQKMLHFRDVVALFDKGGLQFKLYERLAASKKYGKFVRHDMGTSAHGVFGAADTIKEVYDDSDDVSKLIVPISSFFENWPRYIIGMEHLALHEFSERDISIDHKYILDGHTLADAIDGWKEFGESVLYRGTPQEKKLYLRDYVVIDSSVPEVLGEMGDEYEGNTGMLGHAIRSCLYNAVKSRDSGAQVVVQAQRDTSTQDIIITIADNGNGLTQDQLIPDSPVYIFGEGEETSQTGSTGLGLSGLDIDLSKFGIDMSVISKHGIYPVISDIENEAVQNFSDEQLKKYSVDGGANNASTVFQFRIHKKKV